jgi:hypothetical protein
VGVEAFKVFQEVDLTGELPRVNNVVDFGWWLGFLRVSGRDKLVTVIKSCRNTHYRYDAADAVHTSELGPPPPLLNVLELQISASPA